MKAMSKRYGFVTCLVFWCVLHKVKSVPLDFDLPFPLTDFNEKQSIPTDFDQEFNSVTDNILRNIENHYNTSEIGAHSSENAIDLNNEFKNQTFTQNEIIKNDTQTNLYQLSNSKLNQIQTKNDTNYWLQVKDASQAKQSFIRKQGKVKDARDYYKNEDLSKNVTLKTTNDRTETSEFDQALQTKETLANVTATGDLRYEARNNSDIENREISSQYAKSGRQIEDKTAQKVKNIQDAYFTRIKTIHQTNDKRTNSEKEQFTKSGSKDYVKEVSSGLETLQKKCLNHLSQENQYKDQDKEIRRMGNRKNKKKTFFKRLGDSGPKSSWPNWDDFPEDCKDLLQEEINIQNLSEGTSIMRNEEPRTVDKAQKSERCSDNDTNVENSTKDCSTPPTPTQSPHGDSSRSQTNPDTKQTKVDVIPIETTTAKGSSLENHSKQNESPMTVTASKRMEEPSGTTSDGLSALRKKFDIIKDYLSKDKGCDDNKYGFSERLRPMGQATKTKSSFAPHSRRIETDPNIIFQDKNIINQTIECVEGQVNCNQDYYEYYYIEENVYGDEDYTEDESSPDELLPSNLAPRQYKATNTRKMKTTHKKHSPLAIFKTNSIRNETKSS